MKTLGFLTLVMVLASASSAYAMKVTNLDLVPHMVIYRTVGEEHLESLAPQQTAYFPGLTDGIISLKDATPASVKGSKPIKKSKDSGSVHADGLLAGMFGAVRTEDIPASGEDEFVIWPGGDLRRQFHREGWRF